MPVKIVPGDHLPSVDQAESFAQRAHYAAERDLFLGLAFHVLEDDFSALQFVFSQDEGISSLQFIRSSHLALQALPLVVHFRADPLEAKLVGELIIDLPITCFDPHPLPFPLNGGRELRLQIWSKGGMEVNERHVYASNFFDAN